MKTKLLLIILIIFFQIIVIPSISISDGMKNKIDAQAKRIKEYSSLLKDPDPSVRLATLDVMFSSKEIAMKEMARSICFSSGEFAIQSTCLKYIVSDMSMVIIYVEESNDHDEKKEDKKPLSLYNWEIREYNIVNGTFKTYCNGNGNYGLVKGNTLEISCGSNHGSFSWDENSELSGKFYSGRGIGHVYSGKILIK